MILRIRSSRHKKPREQPRAFYWRFCCRVMILAASLIFMPLGCTITTEGVQQAEAPMDEIFPPSKVVASYRQLKKPTKPSTEELITQLDGKQKLAILRKWTLLASLVADYGIPGQPAKARALVVEMGSKQNAYGAYTNLRPSSLKDSDYLKIGVHATLDGDRLLFVQDRFVIVIRALSDVADSARRAMLINFARAISDRIPRDITDIQLVGYLPFENRVPATERLDKEDPLHLGLFKNGGVTALYRIEDRECKVFLASVETVGATKSLLQDVRRAAEKEGAVIDLSIGAEGYQGRLFKSLAMFSRRELVVFGCYGTMTEKEMRNVMAGLDRRIKPYVPPKVKERKPTNTDEEDKK